MVDRKIQVTIILPKGLLQLLDDMAELLGSPRSDLIRRAIEEYLEKLKQSSLIQDLKGVSDYEESAERSRDNKVY
jgi:metal-responsive CopG/Arc/MetJ family transcriptional regulator